MYPEEDKSRARSAQESTTDKSTLFARGRLSEARKWFGHLGWTALPQNTRGRRILQWGADQAYLASPTHPDRSVRRWCRRWAPWLSDAKLNEIIVKTRKSNKRWSADQCATVLEISVVDRKALGFRFIGADDDPNYEIRLGIKRAKGKERARKFRLTHSTGRPVGRPADPNSQENRKRKDREYQKAKRSAQGFGRPVGRPRSEGVPAWQAAGYSNARTYQRHKGRGVAKNASAENASRHITNRDGVTEFMPTEFLRHFHLLKKINLANGADITLPAMAWNIRIKEAWKRRTA